MGNITFTMIKPEAVAAGNTGAILNKIEAAGFRIVAIKKYTYLKKELVSFMRYIVSVLSMTN